MYTIQYRLKEKNLNGNCSELKCCSKQQETRCYQPLKTIQITFYAFLDCLLVAKTGHCCIEYIIGGRRQIIDENQQVLHKYNKKNKKSIKKIFFPKKGRFFKRFFIHFVIFMKYLLIFINDLTSAAYYIFDATIFIFDVTSFFSFFIKGHFKGQ